VQLDIFKILKGAVKFPSVDGLSGLAGVLEADAQVAATASSRAGGGNAFGGGVADLLRLLDTVAEFWEAASYCKAFVPS
jgi:hypothetical protein